MKDFLKNVLANITAILILCGVFFIFIMMMIAVSSAFEDGKAKLRKIPSLSWTCIPEFLKALPILTMTSLI